MCAASAIMQHPDALLTNLGMSDICNYGAGMKVGYRPPGVLLFEKTEAIQAPK